VDSSVFVPVMAWSSSPPLKLPHILPYCTGNQNTLVLQSLRDLSVRADTPHALSCMQPQSSCQNQPM
jgi:hypothetical protein